MTFQKYLVLAGVTVFSAAGDSLLARGMKESGSVSPHDLSSLILTILNPWVVAGIVFLLAFFAAYTSTLSWADLTYVLPASSLGYVLVAFAGRFIFHEQISIARWLGIAMITAGVGFVAVGPSVTPKPEPQKTAPDAVSQEVIS